MQLEVPQEMIGFSFPLGHHPVARCAEAEIFLGSPSNWIGERTLVDHN
jgi:hypothetical protein